MWRFFWWRVLKEDVGLLNILVARAIDAVLLG